MVSLIKREATRRAVKSGRRRRWTPRLPDLGKWYARSDDNLPHDGGESPPSFQENAKSRFVAAARRKQ